jgi:hypothetical protein
MTDRQGVPYDRGWAWMIVLGKEIVWMVVLGKEIVSLLYIVVPFL